MRFWGTLVQTILENWSFAIKKYTFRSKRICFRHTFYTFNENLMLKTIFSIKKVCFPSEKYVFYQKSMFSIKKSIQLAQNARFWSKNESKNGQNWAFLKIKNMKKRLYIWVFRHRETPTICWLRKMHVFGQKKVWKSKLNETFLLKNSQSSDTLVEKV